MEETQAIQTEQTGQSTEKTFTQKELDDIVQQRQIGRASCRERV